MNLRKLTRQLKELQELQQTMANTIYEGKSGNGLVTVFINGHAHLSKLSISPDVIKQEDHELLEDLILAAYNNAKKNLPDPSMGQNPEDFSKLFGKMN